MIIEPHVQNLLCTGYKGIPPPIRIIYDNFPKVSVIWPDNQDLDDRTTTVDNPVRSVVQLRGDRQQVDAAAERLQKLIKQVIDENHRQEVSPVMFSSFLFWFCSFSSLPSPPVFRKHSPEELLICSRYINRTVSIFCSDPNIQGIPSAHIRSRFYKDSETPR